MLKGKNILLGVTGSIAAYKIASLASMLVKMRANVDVIMTKNACNFINPITFETLTGNKCIVDTFDRNFEFQVEHVSLAKKADVALIAPASANVIGKIANGICDDMLTTTIFACKCPILIAPAMNTNMFTNPILQDNMAKLKHYGYHFVSPQVGYLACKDTGIGKMEEPEILLEYIVEHALKTQELSGKKVVITAGPTQESIDPVRYITNHSSGKMGYALAKMAYMKGAKVTLISGKVNIKAFHGIEVQSVRSAKDMFEAVKEQSEAADIVIMCAAVADYTPASCAEHKIKKAEGDLSIPLQRTTDILQYLGEHRKPNQILVGFSMETENLIENSKKKLEKKKVDLICANTIGGTDSGFQTDTNIVTLITKDQVVELGCMPKEEVAKAILEQIIQL